jgi:hypothetical protein
MVKSILVCEPKAVEMLCPDSLEETKILGWLSIPSEIGICNESVNDIFVTWISSMANLNKGLSLDKRV